LFLRDLQELPFYTLGFVFCRLAEQRLYDALAFLVACEAQTTGRKAHYLFFHFFFTEENEKKSLDCC
jgi:hypothetical protein